MVLESSFNFNLPNNLFKMSIGYIILVQRSSLMFNKTIKLRNTLFNFSKIYLFFRWQMRLEHRVYEMLRLRRLMFILSLWHTRPGISCRWGSSLSNPWLHGATGAITSLWNPLSWLIVLADSTNNLKNFESQPMGFISDYFPYTFWTDFVYTVNQKMNVTEII